MEEDNEMVKVREIFERALNAIVSATQLAREVEQLRVTVSTIQHDLDNYRAENARLDNELALVREQRDQALRDKQAAIEELNATRCQRETSDQSALHWEQKHHDLNQRHESLKHEHDNVQLELIQTQDEVKELKSKLEKVKAVFGIQPRDPASGQWESPREVLQEVPPVQGNQPKTGTDPYWR